ncbi:Putative large ATP-binding protein [Sinomonas atrocyanea]|uniref:Putative large ATP-binding protein n=2 Tax=Sinomonas atrocyanea TaxID=37927 RepID=A0A126ZYK2_9MICC|nr:Putative large ATP-binding protein [Sinomonas atrocyanea]
MGGDPDKQQIVSVGGGCAEIVGADPDVYRGDGTERVESNTAVFQALVPFAFMWEPPDGVNGIGSGSNLRGKSSVVEILLWSLSGRCAVFSVAVRRWVEHVEIDWVVGTERLRVAFDADNGNVSNGSVTVIEENGAHGPVIATFDDDEAFEDAMSSVMLNRLRLESFTVSQSGKPVTHKWASYVNALWVRPKDLKSIIGKEATLSVRLMQMFIGTDWVPVLATASTVAGSLEAKRKAAAERTKTATEAMEGSLAAAQKAAKAVEAKIAELPEGTPDPAKLAQTNARISDLVRQIHESETQLLSQSVAADTVRQQLKAARARHHTEYEHALLTKFFHQMEPTVCPRCTAGVTADRRAAEPEQHKCSVCTSDLNLEALKVNVVVASSVDEAVTTALVGATAAVSEDNGEELAPKTEIEALEEAAARVEIVMAGLRKQIDELQVTHDGLVTETALDAVLAQAVEDRRLLEIELARAEGAAQALATPASPVDVSPIDPIQLAVAEAAERVLSRWVKGHQDPLLARISAEIERLVVNFGADSLSNIKLDGAANMTLRQNGDQSTYGQVTHGEQLRLKIATVISLIKHGYIEGIGRHPGFLLLDSPAAEEMPDGDLATMLSALLDVAREAPMQIIVATRSTGPLVELLPGNNRLIAEGDSFVW